MQQDAQTLDVKATLASQQRIAILDDHDITSKWHRVLNDKERHVLRHQRLERKLSKAKTKRHQRQSSKAALVEKRTQKDALSHYISKLPSLTETQERHLVSCMLKGDLEARQTLIESHLVFVQNIIAKDKSSIDKDDLFQEGVSGLIQAIDSYQLNQDTRVQTWAYQSINAAIRRYKQYCYAIKATDAWNALPKIIKKQMARERYSLNDNDIEELSVECGISKDQIKYTISRFIPHQRFDAQTQDEDQVITSMIERFPSDHLSPEQIAGCNENHRIVRTTLCLALYTLSKRDRKILWLRGWRDTGQWTYKQLGEKFGISHQAVNKAEVQALQHLLQVFTVIDVFHLTAFFHTQYAEDLRQQLFIALCELNKTVRKVIWLRYRRKTAYKDIATRCGISVDKVKKLEKKGLKLLFKQMTHQYNTSELIDPVSIKDIDDILESNTGNGVYSEEYDQGAIEWHHDEYRDAYFLESTNY